MRNSGVGSPRSRSPSCRLRQTASHPPGTHAGPVRREHSGRTNSATLADNRTLFYVPFPVILVRRLYCDDNKGAAVIKCEGKKDRKPSRVRLLRRDDGPVLVYLFPRTTEITKQ